MKERQPAQRTPESPAPALLLALAACSWGLPAHAEAREARVDAALESQFYTLTSPFGEPVVRRRRYTQTLGLSVFGLDGGVLGSGPWMSFRARMRLDANLGQDGVERDPESGRFIPGLQRTPLDLMYAYLEGGGYFDGLVGFRLGRQYVADVLGWWSFDGALLSLTTPVYVELAGYAGFEQRGGLPLLGTSRFEAQGIYRGDRREIEDPLWPSFLDSSELAPAYGFSLKSHGFYWLNAEASYRSVQNRDAVFLAPFTDASGRLETYSKPRPSSQKLGSAAELSAAELGSIGGSAVYDLYNRVLSDAAAHADFFVTPALTLGADYDYYYPTFDADSIFNWFVHSGSTSVLGRASAVFSRELDAAVAAGVRVYEQAEGASGSERGQVFDGRTRYRWQRGTVSTRSLLEWGELQHRYGGDVSYLQEYAEGLYETLVSVSLYDWSNELRASRDATSLTYVLGAGLYPARRWTKETRLGLEWEHSINRLVGDRFRVLGTVSMAVGM